MGALHYVLPFVLASVGVGVGIGFYLGIGLRRNIRSRELERQRAATLKVLANLLSATERLTRDVDTHNTEIREVGQHVVDLNTDGELRDVQHALLRNIAAVLSANHRLEEDLQYARYRMEEQAVEIDRTRREARTDKLSGVPNRQAFDEKLQMMLTDWRRRGEPFVLVLADVDHFKWINDTHGHLAGDRVVSGVGSLLRRCVREQDFVGRYGGDEFAILLANMTLPQGAQLAERLRQRAAETTFDLGGEEKAAITFSIGLAAAFEGADPESIVHRADAALYRSKELGRNKVYCYREDGQIVPHSQFSAAAAPPTAATAVG